MVDWAFDPSDSVFLTEAQNPCLFLEWSHCMYMKTLDQLLPGLLDWLSSWLFPHPIFWPSQVVLPGSTYSKVRRCKRVHKRKRRTGESRARLSGSCSRGQFPSEGLLPWLHYLTDWNFVESSLPVKKQASPVLGLGGAIKSFSYCLSDWLWTINKPSAREQLQCLL